LTGADKKGVSVLFTLVNGRKETPTPTKHFFTKNLNVQEKTQQVNMMLLGSESTN
jgi:hypothetical protein